MSPVSAPPTDPAHSAWLVDLDGTLYDPRPLKRAMALRLLGAAPWAVPSLRVFRQWHERLRESGATCEPNPFERQLAAAAEELGADPEQLRARVQNWMVERPAKLLPRFRREGLIAELRTHRAAGGRLALVSDYPAQLKLAGLGLRDLFEVVVANGEPGSPQHLKPHPEGYLLAAERLGVAPEGCLVVGDRDDADGEAARRAGMAFRLVE